MAGDYDKTNFTEELDENGNPKTPVSAENLGKMDDWIDDVDKGEIVVPKSDNANNAKETEGINSNSIESISETIEQGEVLIQLPSAQIIPIYFEVFVETFNTETSISDFDVDRKNLQENFKADVFVNDVEAEAVFNPTNNTNFGDLSFDCTYTDNSGDNIDVQTRELRLYYFDYGS